MDIDQSGPTQISVGGREVLLHASPSSSPSRFGLGVSLSLGREDFVSGEDVAPWQASSPTDTSRLASFGGDAGGPERREFQQAYALEGNLQLGRDLLSTQLRDLDSWCSQQRRVEHASRDAGQSFGEDVCIDRSPAVTQQSWAPTVGWQPSGVESILQAQLRELEGLLSEARGRAETDLHNERLLKEHQREDGYGFEIKADGVIELGCERRMATKACIGQPPGSTAGAKHMRIDAAGLALRRLRDFQQQRVQVFRHAEGVHRDGSEDLATVHAQLKELEEDPWRNPDLQRHATTDVAIAFVAAIEQRLALAKSFGEALRSRDEARSAAENHEQLGACCAYEERLRVGQVQPPADAERWLPSPAARLVLETPYLRQAAERAGPPCDAPLLRRAQQLAEKNAELWGELSRLQAFVPDAASRLRKDLRTTLPHPHSELYGLRSPEGKLEAVLRDKARLAKPSASSVSAARAAAALGKLDVQRTLLRIMMTVRLEDIVQGWQAAAQEQNLWRRHRRFVDRRRLLGRRGPKSWVYFFLVSSMTTVIEQPLPKSTRCALKPRVRDADGYEGILLSSTSEGMSKVLYGEPLKHEVLVVPTESLVWLKEKSHPALAWVVFCFWWVYLACNQEATTKKVRRKLVESRSAVLVSWLSLDDNDPGSLKNFVFTCWRKALRGDAAAAHSHKAKIWRAWRQSVHQSRHERAIDDLRATQMDLHTARISILRQHTAADKIMKRISKIQKAEDMLKQASVIAAWRLSTDFGLEAMRYRKASSSMQKAAYEQGIVAAFRVSGFLGSQSVKTLVKDQFNVWKKTVAAKRRKRLVQRSLNEAFYRQSASWVFSAWQGAIMMRRKGREKEHGAKAEAAKAEMNHLKQLSAELYSFAEDADGRVQELEDLLRSADHVMRAGCKQNEEMEQRVHQMRSEVVSASQKLADTEEVAKAARIEREEVDLIRKQVEAETVARLERELEEATNDNDRWAALTTESIEKANKAQRQNRELQQRINEVIDKKDAIALEREDFESAIWDEQDRQERVREEQERRERKEREAAALAAAQAAERSRGVDGSPGAGVGIDESTTTSPPVPDSEPPVDPAAWVEQEEELEDRRQQHFKRMSAEWKTEAASRGLKQSGGDQFVTLKADKKRTLDMGRIGRLPTYQEAAEITEKGRVLYLSSAKAMFQFSKPAKDDYFFRVHRWLWETFLVCAEGVQDVEETFSLMELVEQAFWIWDDNDNCSIKNLHVGRQKGKLEIQRIPKDFFKALVKIVLEIEYRRQHGIAADPGW